MNDKPIAVDGSRGNRIWRQLYIQISRIPAVWILVLPFLLLIPSMGLFPYPASGSPFSDLTITHYPNTIYLRNAIAIWHEIPLWSSTILGGYPFAANPLSGMWYPPGWLLLISPLPLGFNLLVGLHLIWGGFGLYRLMREEGLDQVAALFAGLSFALLPKLFAHYGAGHLTLLFALPWTPWLLLSQQVYVKDSGRFKIPPGVILALIFLADVRWGAYACMAWWFYSAAHRENSWRNLIREIAFQTGLALLLAAPLLLPLIEYSTLSTRSDLAAEDILAHSLPVVNLLGLLFPNNQGNHEWVLYSGGIVLLLGVIGVIVSKLQRNKYFWSGLCIISIFIALGSQIPGSESVASLPLISLLRVPSRALFLTGLGLAALAGYGMDAILINSKSPWSGKIGTILFGIITFSLLLAAGLIFLVGETSVGMLWGIAGSLVGAVWIAMGIKKKLPLRLWIVGVFLILIIDLMMVDLNSFEGRSAKTVLSEREEVASYISDQSGDVRTYSPSYSIPQQTAVLHGLQMTDGVDPLQIKSYVRFMDEASGVPRDGYSVTVPPFATGEPRTDNALYMPDPEKLGILNVGYVASDFNIDVEGLVPIQQIGDVRVYKNVRQRFPAWVQFGAVASEEAIKPAEILGRSPNRILVSATGPGALVVSEIHYPGWRARIDGEDAEVLIFYETLMGMDLEPGEHEVELLFKPMSLTIGLLLFGLGAILLVWKFGRSWRRKSEG